MRFVLIAALLILCTTTTRAVIPVRPSGKPPPNLRPGGSTAPSRSSLPTRAASSTCRSQRSPVLSCPHGERSCFGNPDGGRTWSQNIIHSARGQYEAHALNPCARTGHVNAIRGDTITSDPLFMDWRDQDFRYREGSPAIERGLPILRMDQASRRNMKKE